MVQAPLGIPLVPGFSLNDHHLPDQEAVECVTATAPRKTAAIQYRFFSQSRTPEDKT